MCSLCNRNHGTVTNLVLSGQLRALMLCRQCVQYACAAKGEARIVIMRALGYLARVDSSL